MEGIKMATTIITITIIVTGLVGAIGGNYTKKPAPAKEIAQLFEPVDIDLVELMNI